MNSNLQSLKVEVVKVESGNNPRYCVIWLHGLGADGYDFVPVVKELEQMGVPPTRYIFPHAPKIPVSINGGYVMPAWYDIKNSDLGRMEDEAGIRQSAACIEGLIQEQIQSGIPANRIVLAGFSQGGAITYHAGIRGKNTLAGLVCLSTYLPLDTSLDAECNPANANVPVFAAHGTRDGMVPAARGEKAVNLLKAKGQRVDWHTYPMEHSVCGEEMEAIAEFFKKVLVK